MSESETVFNRFQKLSPGMSRFLSLSVDFRQKLINDCIKRWDQDKTYLEEQGLKMENLVEGRILPSGNKIGIDENGRRFVISPVTLKALKTN